MNRWIFNPSADPTPSQLIVWEERGHKKRWVKGGEFVEAKAIGESIMWEIRCGMRSHFVYRHDVFALMLLEWPQYSPIKVTAPPNPQPDLL